MSDTHTTTNKTAMLPWMQNNMFSPQQTSIMSLRWENKDLIKQLWLNLAYMDLQTIDGKEVPIPITGAEYKAPLNKQGARAVINLVVSIINPVVSLTKIHQDQANILIKHTKRSLRMLITTHRREYGIRSGSDMQAVFQIVENIIVAQLYRAVNGHESHQSRMNLVEQRGDYTTTTGREGINLFGKRRKEL